MNNPLIVLSIIGTRPEAIKMAPVIRELERRPAEFQSIVCSTGQHRQMLDQVLSLFNLRVDRDLKVMTHNQSLAQLTAALIQGLDALVDELKPDWIVAQGDTTSVMAASLVAYYRRIKFAHVEAGLRTGNLYKPFPEEANRIIADALSALYFAPTPRSRDTLLKLGVPAQRALMTGNTVVDALHAVRDLPFEWSKSPLASLPESGRYVLITAHRRESFGGPMRDMFLALADLVDRFASDNLHFVYPVHLNPNVRAAVDDILRGRKGIHLIEPVDYLSLINLMKRSVLILTDSGGIQEEAPTFKVPVLVMRDETERQEALEAGTAMLVGTSREKIVTEASRLLESESARAKMTCDVNPFGDGTAAGKIVDAIRSYEE